MKEDDLYKIVWMSRPLMQAAEACVEQGLEGTGLTVRMRAVLEVLHTEDAQTVPDIAARLEIQRQYVQLMVNETVEAGFTKLHPNPRHKRSPLVELTEAGSALIESAMSNERALMRQVADDFTSDEVSNALRVVLDVHKKLKAHADGLPQ